MKCSRVLENYTVLEHLKALERHHMVLGDHFVLEHFIVLEHLLGPPQPWEVFCLVKVAFITVCIVATQVWLLCSLICKPLLVVALALYTVVMTLSCFIGPFFLCAQQCCFDGVDLYYVGVVVSFCIFSLFFSRSFFFFYMQVHCA